MKNQICIYHMISYIFLISNFILRVLYILTFDNVYTWTNSNYSTTWKKYILPTNYFKMRKSFLRRILTWLVGCSYETRFKRIFLYVSNSLYLRTWSLYPFVSVDLSICWSIQQNILEQPLKKRIKLFTLFWYSNISNF